MTANPLPLEGVRVADFSVTLPGPLATALLWQLGAQVIKIERPGTGDPVRGFGMYDLLNVGKRSVALDLREEAGRTAAGLIVAHSDVLVEGFRPGVLAKYGLSYEQASQRWPQLIYCSLSGFGQNGPRRLQPGHDLTYAALSSLTWLSRNVDGSLVRAAPAVRAGDLVGALLAVVGTQAALRERDRTARGGLIDVALQDAAMLAGLVDFAEVLAGNRPPEQRFTVEGDTASYRAFETRDGEHIALGITSYEDVFWRRFCRATGRDDLAEFDAATPGGTDAITEQLETLFAGRSRAEWEHLLADVDVPWAPVLPPQAALDDEHARHRGVYRDGLLRMPVGRPVRHEGDVAALGEDTAEVLRELGAGSDLIDTVCAGISD